MRTPSPRGPLSAAALARSSRHGDISGFRRLSNPVMSPCRGLPHPGAFCRYCEVLSSERAASNALTVAQVFPPHIKSIAERRSAIAPAGIPSQ